jgi:hypothetical protein
MKLAHVHHRTKVEPLWHVQFAVLAAIALQVVLNDRLTFGPKYLIAGFETALLMALMILPKSGRAIWRFKRSAALLLIALISLANIVSLGLVIHALFSNSHVTGRELIVSGLAIYLTNIIVFGLWYWELDSNGVQGQSPKVRPIDFLFPQMTPGEHVVGPGLWAPTFLDYLYVSTTNAAAFSPTDTMPLTHRAKALMSSQSIISLVTIALVAARAVSILG